MDQRRLPLSVQRRNYERLTLGAIECSYQRERALAEGIHSSCTCDPQDWNVIVNRVFHKTNNGTTNISGMCERTEELITCSTGTILYNRKEKKKNFKETESSS